MKHDLKKQVSQLIFELVHVAGLDGIGILVGFLDGVGDSRKGLLTSHGQPFQRRGDGP